MRAFITFRVPDVVISLRTAKRVINERKLKTHNDQKNIEDIGDQVQYKDSCNI